MTRYRLDERLKLRNLSRGSQIWLERIELTSDPAYPIFYTEDYRQVSLSKLLKLLARKTNQVINHAIA